MSDSVQTRELGTSSSTGYDGQLVAVPGNPAVYLVVNGRACWVPDPGTLAQLCGDAVIQSLTQDEFDTLPMGDALASGAYTATTDTRFPMYLISGDAHMFASNALFNRYPFDPANTRTLSESTIIQLGLGWEIFS